MNTEHDPETLVERPTYLGNIRHFFEEADRRCMRRQDIELGTYEGVRFHAVQIYNRTREGTMPPEGENRRWSEARVQTFYNWMENGYQRGEAPRVEEERSELSAKRVRKDLASMDPNGEEMKKIKRAFQGLMDRNVEAPDSYFQVAALHWLPGPDVFCRHHENAYNPWHRAYLLKFEDALRTVEGCEDVTLPYWNIQSQVSLENLFRADKEKVVGIPDVLFEDPFGEYVLPRRLENLDGSNVYEKGSATKRRDESAILCLLSAHGVSKRIEEALSRTRWELFNGWDAGRTQGGGIILAHDNAHVACGETLANQDVTAFDPMFWFFHANWDRLWWKWQKMYSATILDRFKTHLGGSADWLEDDVLNGLPPFDYRTKDMIDLSVFDVDYEAPVCKEPTPKGQQTGYGSLSADVGFTLAEEGKVSVRVKGIDRLEIPGSFDVSLMVGDRIVGRQSLFQSTTPKHCSTCKKNPLANFDFVINSSELEGGLVRVSVSRVTPGRTAVQVPLSKCGSPSINARALIRYPGD